MPGRPDELFFLPECNGGIDGLLLPVSTEKLRFVSDNWLQHEDEINEFQNRVCAGDVIKFPNPKLKSH